MADLAKSVMLSQCPFDSLTRESMLFHYAHEMVQFGRMDDRRRQDLQKEKQTLEQRLAELEKHPGRAEDIQYVKRDILCRDACLAPEKYFTPEELHVAVNRYESMEALEAALEDERKKIAEDPDWD